MFESKQKKPFVRGDSFAASVIETQTSTVQDARNPLSVRWRG